MPLYSIPRAPPDDLRGVPVLRAVFFLRALPCEAPMGRDGRAVFFLISPFGGIAWHSADTTRMLRFGSRDKRWEMAAHAPVAGKRA